MPANPYSIDLEARQDEGRSRQELVGIAGRYRPPVVQGSIAAAHLQLAWCTMKTDRKHLDRELAARNHRSRAQAGTPRPVLSSCAPGEDGLRLRRAAREREITATVLPL